MIKSKQEGIRRLSFEGGGGGESESRGRVGEE